SNKNGQPGALVESLWMLCVPNAAHAAIANPTIAITDTMLTRRLIIGNVASSLSSTITRQELLVICQPRLSLPPLLVVFASILILSRLVREPLIYIICVYCVPGNVRAHARPFRSGCTPLNPDRKHSPWFQNGSALLCRNA